MSVRRTTVLLVALATATLPVEAARKSREPPTLGDLATRVYLNDKERMPPVVSL